MRRRVRPTARSTNRHTLMEWTRHRGGIGGISVAIANVYRHMTITLQDQPTLVEQGRQVRSVGGSPLSSTDSFATCSFSTFSVLRRYAINAFMLCPWTSSKIRPLKIRIFTMFVASILPLRSLTHIQTNSFETFFTIGLIQLLFSFSRMCVAQ